MKIAGLILIQFIRSAFVVNFNVWCVVLSCRYDSRVKAMEVDERPTEQYSDIGGLDQQIQEVDLSCYFSVLQVDVN